MYDLTKTPEGCVTDPPYDARYCGFNDADDCEPLNGCGTESAIPFFLMCVFLINFVFLSVFISVIISSYNDANENAIRPEEFQTFALHWALFDPEATCYIKVAELPEFTRTLFKPFGFQFEVFSRRQYVRRVGKICLCKVFDSSGLNPELKVHFSDVIMVLSVAHYEKRSGWNNNIDFDLKREPSKHSMTDEGEDAGTSPRPSTPGSDGLGDNTKVGFGIRRLSGFGSSMRNLGNTISGSNRGRRNSFLPNPNPSRTSPPNRRDGSHGLQHEPPRKASLFRPNENLDNKNYFRDILTSEVFLMRQYLAVQLISYYWMKRKHHAKKKLAIRRSTVMRKLEKAERRRSSSMGSSIDIDGSGHGSWRGSRSRASSTGTGSELDSNRYGGVHGRGLVPESRNVPDENSEKKIGV